MHITASTNLLMVVNVISAFMNIQDVQAEGDAKWESKVLARTVTNGSYEDGTTDILGIGQSNPKTLNSGKTLILQCFVRLGLSDPNSVRWFKDGVELNSINDPRMVISRVNKNISAVMQQEITLRIPRATVADSGRYMCKASDENNTTVTVTIKAPKPPKLSLRSEDSKSISDGITVREGENSSVQLRCKLLQGNPKPRFSWFKNNKPIHPKENWLTTPSCAHLKEGVYFFTNGSKQDVIICGSPIKYERFSGRYTCQAENQEGIDKVHVDLNILAAAKIQEPRKKHTRLVVQFGKAVHQTCRARGNPPPKVEWRKLQDKDSVLISSGLGNETVSLSLHSVSGNDVGNYSCTARNGHTDQLFVQIMLDNIPVTGGPITSSSYIIGIVIGCVAAALLIAIVTFYLGTRRHQRMRKQYELKSQNVTLRYAPPLQAKELSRGDSKDMIVVCSQPETDFTPSYCDSFQEEDATTREIAEFLARKKEAKSRESIFDPIG